MSPRITSILTLILILLPFASGASRPVAAQEGTPSEVLATGSFSGLVDIGGRSLWLECMGEGSPTVILESGSPFMMNTDWYSVETAIAKITHVCAYDRANVGSSDPAPRPRSVQQMADDLDALLSSAGIPGPYVFAPASFGPLVTRIYASQHPENVAGIAFIDPVPLDLEAQWKAVLPPELSERWVEEFWVGNPEEIDFATSERQLGAAEPLPDVPLLVLAHTPGQGDYLIPDGWPIELLDPIWQELVAAQAQEVPGGRLIVAENASHGMVFTTPDIVAEAVLQVVDAVRDPSSWSAWATPEGGTPTA